MRCARGTMEYSVKEFYPEIKEIKATPREGMEYYYNPTGRDKPFPFPTPVIPDDPPEGDGPFSVE